MRNARIALAAGLALTTVGAAIVLLNSPPRVLGSNGVAHEHKLVASAGSASACQAGEALPAHTTAIRLTLAADLGPTVHVTVLSAGRVLLRGARGPGWAGGAVTVPVRPLSSTFAAVTVCFSFLGAHERVSLIGERTSVSGAARSGKLALPGRTRIEFLGAGGPRWWSLIGTLARRLGLARAWPGAWIALLVATLMLSSTAVAVWLGWRELG